MWWDNPYLFAAALAYAITMPIYLAYRWRTR